MVPQGAGLAFSPGVGEAVAAVSGVDLATELTAEAPESELLKEVPDEGPGVAKEKREEVSCCSMANVNIRQ